MKNLSIALLVLIVVGIGTYYIVFNNSPRQTPSENNPYTTPTSPQPLPVPPPPPSPTPTVSNSPKTPATQSVTITIENFSFSPAMIVVKPGTKVTWINKDTAPHTVTSDTANLLNSSTLSNGQSYSVTITDPGTIKYHCNIHPTMKGSIVVIK